jgi:hypothetical protein
VGQFGNRALLGEERYDIRFPLGGGRADKESVGLPVETEPTDKSFFETLIVGDGDHAVRGRSPYFE